MKPPAAAQLPSLEPLEPLLPLEPLSTMELLQSSRVAAAAPARLTPRARVPEVPANVTMDREFILRNQIVERYLGGRLPLKGAQDFERYCRSHPQLLDEFQLGERIEAGLKLLDVSGKPMPWEQQPRQWWERLPFIASLGAVALLLAVTTLLYAMRYAESLGAAAALRATALERPLDAPGSTRSLVLNPSRTAPSRRNAASFGASGAQMADLKIDVSWSRYTAFRVSIDRIDQGRVAVLGHVLRDSNGHLRVSINTTALGPGSYQFELEGLTTRGELIPQAWLTIGIESPR